MKCTEQQSGSPTEYRRRGVPTVIIAALAIVMSNARGGAAADPPEPCHPEPIYDYFGYQSQTENPQLCVNSAFATSFPIAPLPPVQPSMCWRSLGHNVGTVFCTEMLSSGSWTGLPLNLDLAVGVVPPDLPPKSRDSVSNTLALVGRAPSVYYTGAVAHADRAMLPGSVDMITGSPLLQATGFELPFGSATFRHVRSYAEPSMLRHEHLCTQEELTGGWSQDKATSLYWDWAGQGWMVGENPILLIDAAYKGFDDAPEKRRCYFIIDSHHAIPFIRTQEEGFPVYEPVAGFDAILTYKRIPGVTEWCSTEKRWITPPSEWYVWLNGQSVKYTIDPYYEDVGYVNGPPRQSLHDSEEEVPFGPPHLWRAWGHPYYGLVKKIEDRHGNRVELKYCDQVSTGAGFSGTPCGGESPCQYCTQKCQQKGQLWYARLVANGETEASWTILYIHREMSDDLVYPRCDGNYTTHRQNVLHSVYVFAGEREEGALPACPTIPQSVFTSAGTMSSLASEEDLWFALKELDDVDGLLAVNAVALDSQWSYRVKYLHSDSADAFWMYENEALFGFVHHGGGQRWESPRLIKATTTTRGSGGAEAEATMLYRHRRAAEGQPADRVFLNWVMEAPALEAVRERVEDEDPNSDLLVDWPLRVLAAPDNTVLWTEEPQPGVFVNVCLMDVVSSRYGGWNNLEYGYHSDAAGSCFMKEMVNDFIEPIANEKLAFLSGNIGAIDDRLASGKGAYFRVYRFMQYPDSVTPYESLVTVGGAECGGTISIRVDPTVTRAVHHHPYMVWNDGEPQTIMIAPLDHPLWVVVLDEFDDPRGPRLESPEENCNQFQFAQLPTLADWTTTGCEPPPAPIRRRVVELNAAGYILRDRVWNTSSGELISSEGLLESYVYDNHRRLKEKKTVSWGAASNADTEDANGLVYVYDYDDDPTEEKFATQIGAIGIRQGDGANQKTYLLKQFITDETRPELQTHEIEFLEPYELQSGTPLSYSPLNIPTSGVAVTTTLYDFHAPPDEALVKRKMVARPPSLEAPGGASRYPVEIECYNLDGQMTTKAHGAVADLQDPGGTTGDTLFLETWLFYPYSGLLYEHVVDAEDGDGLTRIAPTELGDARELLTQYGYGFGDRINYIRYPSLREDLFTYKFPEINVEETRIYKILPNGKVWAGTAKVYHASMVVNEQVVEWEMNGSVTGDEPFVVLSETEAERDFAGRITKLESGDVSAHVTRDNLGLISREKHPDGTVTRTVRDYRGRPVGVYRGTDDVHPHWKNANPEDPLSWNDNLVLTEKRYYGWGKRGSAGLATSPEYGNALQLIELRRYRDKPTNQYSTSTCQSDEDEIGWAEVYGYDWRSRQVYTARYASGKTPISMESDTQAFPTALNYSVTWLDHQDRVRLVALYDGATGVPASYDPRVLGPEDPLPTAAALLGQNPPRRLTETIYNARGLVEEVRQYDTSDGTAASYLATLTYYDYGDRPLYRISPGGGVQQFVYDAVGKTVQSIQSIPHPTTGALRQVSRTNSVYDADLNEVETIHWERRHDAPDLDLVLDNTNAVATYTFNWYDGGGRLVATAAMGTSEGSFVQPSNPPQRPTFDATSPPDPEDDQSPVVWDSNGEFDEFRWSGEVVPAGVEITGYRYDGQGRQIAVVSPNESVTTYEYNELDQITLKIEDAYGTHPRATAYAYEHGRLIKMAGGWNPHTSVDPFTVGASHVTEFVYEAEVIGSDHQSFAGLPNKHGGWIGKVRFPNSTTGEPSEDHSLSFEYFIDGSLARRVDARGVEFLHSYDEQGNRTLTEVAYPGGSFAGTTWPVDLVTAIEYGYDETTGQLEDVEATSGGGVVMVAANRFKYDDRGNLRTEWQQHGAAVSETTSPRIDYDWDYSPVSGWNHDRLKSMTYPQRFATTSRREVEFEFGINTDSLDWGLGRITKIFDTSREYAAYSYAGDSRRVATTFGAVGSTSAAAQTYAGGAGYSGLDRHGRAADLHWKKGDGSLATLLRDQYGYDLMGNRAYARTERAGESANERSWLYEYDDLSRLVGADLGGLDGTNSSIAASTLMPDPRRASWTIDTLGNWAGDASAQPNPLPGLLVEQGSTTRAVTHSVNNRNELTSVAIDEGSGPQSVTMVYDRNGNLVADGAYHFQYDAWGRLIQVSEIGTLTFDSDGEVETGAAGTWISHFVYDGLGRLVRKASRFDAQYQRTEHYYYDGVRRIQESITDPLLNDTDDPMSGEDEEGDEEAELYTWTDREYIYSPGYIDEFVAQIDTSAGAGQPERVAFVLQDGNYNVAALIDEGGTVMARYVWDPYGQLLYANLYGGQQFRNRIGHQGLFFDRLDALATADPLVVGARGIYQNRNRSYDPVLGRFLQRDPNGSGVPVLAALAMHGGRFMAPLAHFDGGVLYGDGMSLHAYVGSNPVNITDASGLQWDPFEAADEISLTHQLSAALTLGKIGAFFEDKQVLRKLRAYERGGFLHGELTADRDVGILFSMIGATFFARACFVEGTPVATPDGAVPIDQLSIGDQVLSREDPTLVGGALVQVPPSAVDLFVITLFHGHADGKTTTMEILRPASTIRDMKAVGSAVLLSLPDMGISGYAKVLSVEPFRGKLLPDAPLVTGRFVTTGAEVVNLYVEGQDEPIGVTHAHPIFSVDRWTWIPAGELCEDERVAVYSGAVRLSRILPRGQATVYNVEVSPHHTYFVGEARVWVHNECFPVSKPGGRKVSLDDQTSWIYKTVRSMQAGMKGSSTTNPTKVIRDFIETVIQEASTLNKGAITKERFQQLMKYLDSLLR